MTDPDDPAPSPFETVARAINEIGTSGALEQAAKIRASLEEAADAGAKVVVDLLAAVGGVGEPRTTWSYADYLQNNAEELAGTDFVSREELLELVRQAGDEVSDRMLRGWESAGMLPRPIRRWQEPGARSGARVLYPRWAVNAVWLAKLLRSSGHDVESTREEVQHRLPRFVASHDQGTRDGVIGYHLARTLNEIVGRLPWPQGGTPSQVEIRIRDQDGSELHAQTITIPDGETIDYA